jgi:hypothetical protein
MPIRYSWLAAVVTMAALAVNLTGCGNKVRDQVAAMNTSNIQRVSNLYAAFQTYQGGRGPKDEAEFKEFAKRFDPNKLAMMKIDPNNIESTFVSDRDGKPFKIRYKVSGGRGSVDAVVFEQEGLNGRKQVGFTSAEPEDADDAEYKEMWEGKGYSSPPMTGPSGPVVPGKGGRGPRRTGPIGPPPGAPKGPDGQ